MITAQDLMKVVAHQPLFRQDIRNIIKADASVTQTETIIMGFVKVRVREVAKRLNLMDEATLQVLLDNL